MQDTQDTKDALQIKIDKARLELPEDTRNAIDAVDWRGAIMQIRNKEGYDFIQLGELETETEILLCGLADPEEYPRRIEKGMGISHEAALKLVAEMNERVFKRVKEELIKITEAKKIVSAKTPPHPVVVGEDEAMRTSPGDGLKLENREEILSKIEKPDKTPVRNANTALAGGETHPLIAEKLSGPMQIPSSKTVHSLDNLTKPAAPQATILPKTAQATPEKYDVDPYRETPQ